MMYVADDEAGSGVCRMMCEAIFQMQLGRISRPCGRQADGECPLLPGACQHIHNKCATLGYYRAPDNPRSAPGVPDRNAQDIGNQVACEHIPGKTISDRCMKHVKRNARV